MCVVLSIYGGREALLGTRRRQSVVRPAAVFFVLELREPLDVRRFVVLFILCELLARHAIVQREAHWPRRLVAMESRRSIWIRSRARERFERGGEVML
jgi:hypothetical protein